MPHDDEKKEAAPDPRPTPWTATPPYVGCDGTPVPWTVFDDDGNLVCVVEGYSDEASAQFAAETIARAGNALSHAIDYVDDTGECVFCPFRGDAPEPKHGEGCPLAEVP